MNNRSRKDRKDIIYFRRWSNRNYGAFSSLQREIKIASLAIGCLALLSIPAKSQADSTEAQFHYTLEEVDAVGNDELEDDSPFLRLITLISESKLQEEHSSSLSEILDLYPGIDIRTRGSGGVQSDISINGGSFDQSMVLINGINLASSQTGHFNLAIPLLASQLSKMEILTGSASKNYGLNAYAGAINLLTSPEDTFSFSGGFKAGSYKSSRADLAMQLPLGKSKNFIAVNSSKSDGYRENTDYEQRGFYSHSTLPLKALELELITGFSSKAFGANAFYSPRFPLQYEETSSGFSALKWANMGKHKLAGNLYYKESKDHFLLDRSKPAFYQNYHKTRLAGSDLKYRLSSSMGITHFKLAYRYEKIFSTVLGETLEESVPVKNIDSILYLRGKERSYLSYFMDHSLDLGRFHVNTGLLLHSKISELSSPGFYPGIDMAFYPGKKKIKIHASLNRSMRLPSFTDLYYSGPQNEGNSELNPEKAVSAQLGAEYSQGPLWMQAEAFYRIGSESIDWIWMDSTWKTMNYTRLDSYGIGLNAMWNLGWKIGSWLSVDELQLSYAFTELSKLESQYVSRYALDQLKHKIIASGRLQIGNKIYVKIQGAYQQRDGSYLHYESPDAQPYDKPYTPFTLIDLEAGIEFGALKFYAEVNNLLDREYMDIGNIPLPGRIFHAGIYIRQ